MILLLPLLILSFQRHFLLAHSQLKILSPPSLVTAVRQAWNGSDSIQGATATFGAPSYGDSFVGRIFYTPSASNYCTDDYKDAINALLPPTDSTAPGGGPHPTDSGDVLRKIFLLQRGNCTFVKKAMVAQLLGANAIIAVDNPESTWDRETVASVIIADDGKGGDVSIPTVLVAKEDGKILMDAVTNFAKDVVVQMQWSLPRKSVVTLQFWTESGSTIGQRFLSDFAYHANMLRGHLLFSPHYYVYGLKSGIEPSVVQSLQLCLDGDPGLCSNPPDVSMSLASGKDVLHEDVRQLCLWNVTAKPVDGIAESKYSLEWWEYIRKYSDSCPVVSLSSPRFGTDCSYQVMAAIPGIDVEKVKKCAETEAKNLLTLEKDNRAWGTFALRINGARWGG